MKSSSNFYSFLHASALALITLTGIGVDPGLAQTQLIERAMLQTSETVSIIAPAPVRLRNDRERLDPRRLHPGPSVIHSAKLSCLMCLEYIGCVYDWPRWHSVFATASLPCRGGAHGGRVARLPDPDSSAPMCATPGFREPCCVPPDPCLRQREVAIEDLRGLLPLGTSKLL